MGYEAHRWQVGHEFDMLAIEAAKPLAHTMRISPIRNGAAENFIDALSLES